MTEPVPETTDVAAVTIAVEQNDPPPVVDNTAAEIAAETAVTAVEASTVAVEASTAANEQAATATDIATSAAESADATRDSLAELREELNARDARLLAALDERFGPRETNDQPKEVVVTNANPANTGQGDNSGSGGSDGNGPERPSYRHKFGGRGRR